MKKIFSFLLGTVLAFGTTVFAQDVDNVRIGKDYFGPDDNGVYTLELEAYVTDCIKKAEGTENLPLAYDSETTSLDTMTCKILGFSLCCEKGKAVYIPLQQESADLFSETNYISIQDAFARLNNMTKQLEMIRKAAR